MTVFLVSRVRYDISPALKFGGLRFINDHYVYGDELENPNPGYSAWGLPADVQGRLIKAADEFKPDVDFLLIIGDDLQMIAFAAMLSARYREFSVLRWDRKISDYIPVRLHSYLVPPSRPVSTATTNIGDPHGEERRESNFRQRDHEETGLSNRTGEAEKGKRRS